MDLMLADEVVAGLRVGRSHGPLHEGVMKPRPAFHPVAALRHWLARAQSEMAADPGTDSARSERLSERVWELRARASELVLRVRDDRGCVFEVTDFRFDGRAFQLVLAPGRSNDEPGGPGLSGPARRLLSRGHRSTSVHRPWRGPLPWTPSTPAFGEVARHWAGRVYGVRGGGGFEFEAELEPPVHDGRGHAYLRLGRHGGLWLSFWLAEDGSLWCGDPHDGPTRYADSIVEMVEADALLDGLLDVGPNWSTLCGPGMRIDAAFRDALAFVAGRLGARYVQAASGSVRDAWSGPDVLVLVVPMAGPRMERHGALRVYARDPATTVRILADLQLLGFRFPTEIRPHPLAQRSLLPVDLERSFAGHATLFDRLEIDAAGWLSALRAALARELQGLRPGEPLPQSDPRRRLPELLHAVEVAFAFEADPTWHGERENMHDRLARFLAFWSEHDPALEACLRSVGRGRRPDPGPFLESHP